MAVAGAGTAILGRLPAFAQQRTNGKLKITGVEIWRLDGSREALAGINRQHQAQPLHVYEEYRPKPYSDSPDPRKTTSRVSALYLKLKTDAGLEGLYGPVDSEGAVVVDRQLKNYVIGKDPLAVETLWDQMHRSNRHATRGHYMIALSALDNALWDLRGRYFNQPVYRLLGGPSRSAVQAYGSALGYSVEPEAVQTRAPLLQEQGFRHQKWFLAYGPGDGAEGLRRNVELVAGLRKAVGDSVDIMFDAFMGWDLNYALAWAKQVEQHRPRWIEEAFHPEKIESFAQLRRSTSIPVASGEHFYNRWQTHDYIRQDALDVIQADPEWCGGVSELVKICTLASVHDLQVAPHGHNIHAALHVVASQSPMTCPLVEYLILKMSGNYYHFDKNRPAPVNGVFPLDERPGFGMELDPALIENQTQMKWA
jgi:L-rhamnonate dehydratase